MPITPRTRTTVSSALRRAFAPYAMTTSVALHGAGWVPTAVPALPEQRRAAAAPAAAAPAPQRELAAAGV